MYFYITESSLTIVKSIFNRVTWLKKKRFCSPCYDSKGYITNRILKITRLYKGTIYSILNKVLLSRS